MNLKNALMGLGLAATMAGTLGAQDLKHWSVGMGYLRPLDSTRTWNNSHGLGANLNVDFGYTTMLASTDVPVRISLGFNNLPGDETSTDEKLSFRGMYLGADLYIKTGVENLSLVTGLSLNKWRASYDAPGISESESVKGVKFGGRLGVDYQLTPRFSLNVFLTAVELGTDSTATQGVNPSWIQVGGRFHF